MSDLIEENKMKIRMFYHQHLEEKATFNKYNQTKFQPAGYINSGETEGHTLGETLPPNVIVFEKSHSRDT